ncbi:MAG: GNAT family N-acetyltransferase [Candidatus Lokiarchaeota archaeon]|nr:GNAT family N-acetyltransferase [Candidatus Lokiarchaeota archaeon]
MGGYAPSRAWDAYKCAFYGVFNRSDDEWVGQVTVGITAPRLPEYGVGYIADARFEGKGMMTEAVKAVVGMVFSDMEGLRVRSDCSENNVRSWKLLERCGFTREGHLRQNRRGPDGTVHGDYLYGILREEFDGLVE